jgi:acylphosphatase
VAQPSRKVLRIVVAGRVQGVGFRAFLAREATRLGLAGWARNRGEDEVEALVAGESAALAQFAELARRGPAFARVDSYRDETVESQASMGARFIVAPSV